MAEFFREWGRLLVAPIPFIGRAAAMIKFINAAALASFATAVAAWSGHVPGWILPLVAFVFFYFSLTAGMAWERALTPQVEIGPLTLTTESLGGIGTGLFFIPIKSGPIPMKVKVILNRVEPGGVCHMQHSREGRWRGMRADSDGLLDAREELQYGLIGTDTRQPGANPALFIWSLHECQIHPARREWLSLDLPLEHQDRTRVDIVVNCETADGQRGKPQERTFYIAPDRNSAVGYSVAMAGETPSTSGRGDAIHTFRWYFDKARITVERIFGSKVNPPS